MDDCPDALLFVNGNERPVTEACLGAHNRGFQYADGVFETLRVEAGEMPLLKYHLQRLKRGCALLGLQLDKVFYESLAVFKSRLPEQATGVARLTLTRAEGAVGNYPGSCHRACSVFLYTSNAQLQPGNWLQAPVTLVPMAMRLSPTLNLQGIKHLNRLEYSLATLNFKPETGQEALLLDDRGHIVETPHHNVFALRNTTVVTPSLERVGVRGVMRELVLNVLKNDLELKVEQASMTVDELYSCKEVFLTNAVRGVVPAQIRGNTSPGADTAPNKTCLASLVAEKITQRIKTNYYEH